MPDGTFSNDQISQKGPIIIQLSGRVPDPAAAGVNPDLPRANNRQVGSALYKGQLLPQALWQADVILVNSGNVFRAGKLDAPVHRPRSSQIVFIPYKPDSRVLIGFNEIGGPIRASIVHDEKLKVRKGLTQDALDSFP